MVINDLFYLSAPNTVVNLLNNDPWYNFVKRMNELAYQEIDNDLYNYAMKELEKYSAIWDKATGRLYFHSNEGRVRFILTWS